MTIDLFERYASLDPANAPNVQPEWSAVGTVPLSTANGREPSMQTQQQTPNQPTPPKPKRTKLPLAAAAVAVVLVVGAVVLIASSEDSAPPAAPDATTATTPTAEPDAATTITPTEEPDAATTITPTEAFAISDSYYEAFNAGDVDRVMALFTSDAAFTDNIRLGSRTPAEMKMQYEWNAAQGTQLSSFSCTTQDQPGVAMKVTCRGINRNAFAQALGAPAVPLVTTMTVTPDGITTIHEDVGFPDFTVTQEPFEKWMRTNNPDDVRRTSFGTWTTVEEAREFGVLVARYADEWATYLTTNGCIFQNECIVREELSPGEAIAVYIAAYNAKDIDAVMAFFAEESVVTRHPFALEARGLSAIRALHGQDLSAAAAEDAYTITNVEVASDTVTWDHVWISSDSTRYCRDGNVAVVRNGTILSWVWSANDSTICP